MRSARLAKKRENGPEIPAFRAFDFVSGLICEYSRFAETIGGDWFDHDCRPKTAVDFALLRPCMQRLLGATIPVSIVLFLFLVERFDRKQDQRIALLLWIDLFKHCRRPSAARHVQPERGIGFVDVARNGGVDVCEGES